MKKILLLAVAALLAGSVSAQKASPFYELPAGTFYAGYAKQAYGLSSAMLYVPPFTDLTFVAKTTDATAYQWQYPDPGIEYNFTNPLLSSTEQSITVNYLPSSSTMDAPVLTVTNAEGDSTSTVPKYMRVGGESGLNTNTQTYFGFSNVSTKMGASMYYSTAYYMTNNETSAANWKRIAAWDSVSLRGFGELFYSSGAPMALTGISTLIRLGSANVLPDCNLLLRLYEATLTATGGLSSIKSIGYQYLAPSELEVEANGTRAYVLFDKLRDMDGNLVEGFTVTTPILATITLANATSTSQFGVYYRNSPNNISNHAYVILNGVDGNQNAVTGSIRNGGINWSGGTYTRSLGINMIGSFEYLVEAESNSRDTYVFTTTTAGGEKEITLKSSKPYADDLGLETNWTITQADGSELPEWVSVSVNDEYTESTASLDPVYTGLSTVKVTTYPLLSSNGVMRNGSEGRSCDIKLSYLGAEYTIQVNQESSPTTAIDNINVDAATEGVTYDMMGRRVTGDAKGLLIRNGKKIFVK